MLHKEISYFKAESLKICIPERVPMIDIETFIGVFIHCFPIKKKQKKNRKLNI